MTENAVMIVLIGIKPGGLFWLSETKKTRKGVGAQLANFELSDAVLHLGVFLFLHQMKGQ